MLLGEPTPTPFDINFSIMGVPVRVHPLFFLGVLILAGSFDFLWLVIFGAAVFLSLLVHELGHVMAFLHYGIRARVVLLFLGGLAIPDAGGGGGIWSNFGAQATRRRSLQGWPQVIISAAGPAAGLGLAAVVIIATRLAGGNVEFDFSQGIHFWRVSLEDPALNHLRLFIEAMLFCNILWSLLNLLPIFPLDGGQIARELFVMAEPWRGISYSLWLSLLTAGGIAIWALSQGNLYMAMWFFFFGFGAYQQLQGIGGGGRRPW